MKILSRLLLLGIAIVALAYFLGSGFVKDAGNAALNAINGSNAQGVAQLIPSTTGIGTDLQVHLEGLAFNSNYEISLDQNQCGGPVVLDVGRVTTDANGTANIDFSLANLGNALLHPLWLDIHQGFDTSGQSIACGQVQVNGALLPQRNTPTANSNSTTTSGTGQNSTIQNSGPANSENKFPHTGVAPQGGNSYDNYTFPRKY